MPPKKHPVAYHACLAGPGFWIGLQCLAEGPQAGALARIDLLPVSTPGAPAGSNAPPPPLSALPPGTAQQAGLARAQQQLQAWLDDPAYRFSLPLAARGSGFQQRVWAAIAAIPCGQTRSYGQLATALGSAARAVGQACGANPLPLIVPCHRVIAASGRLGGFDGEAAGSLPALKHWLLAREGVAVPAALSRSR